MFMKKYDFIIIGSGIIGLTIAHAIKERKPDSLVLILDKEPGEARHASGRNSGVLHAGFYYTADSLKAKFTVEGNRAMKAYVNAKGLAINQCGKLVVAQDDNELGQLDELYRRGKKNGSNVLLIDEAEAFDIDPNAKTFKRALYSPDTASIDPKEVCAALKEDLLKAGVEFSYNTKYLSHSIDIVQTNQGDFQGGKIINCAGWRRISSGRPRRGRFPWCTRSRRNRSWLSPRGCRERISPRSFSPLRTSRWRITITSFTTKWRRFCLSAGRRMCIKVPMHCSLAVVGSCVGI